jgi:hypothetical protein
MLDEETTSTSNNMDECSSTDIFTYSTDSTRTYDSYVNSLRKVNSNKEGTKQIVLHPTTSQNLDTSFKNTLLYKNQPKMSTSNDNFTGDPSITPSEIQSFTKVANKVLGMFQPGLVLEPGLKFSVGATSTQNLENPAPVEDNIVEEVAYGGSSASFKPAPPTTYEHFAALANLDAIKEEEMSYRCFSPFSIGSSMIFSADTEEKSINKPGSSVGVKEGWAKEKRPASRSTSTQSSDKEDKLWEDKRRKKNDDREVHSSIVAATSTQLLLVNVNRKFSDVARDYRNLKARLDAKDAHDNALWSKVCILEGNQSSMKQENAVHFAAMVHQGLNVPKRQGAGTYIPNLADLIIDTAASAHMLTELSAFYDLRSANSTIRLADGSSIQVFLRGTVKVSTRDNKGRLRFLELTNCLYVPSLSHSLFSIPSYLRAHRENTVTFFKRR